MQEVPLNKIINDAKLKGTLKKDQEHFSNELQNEIKQSFEGHLYDLRKSLIFSSFALIISFFFILQE